MPVAITKPGEPSPFPLTSPPKKPEPAPAAELLHKVVDCVDRKIWVTVPFPDTVELIAPILNESLDVPDQSGKNANQIYSELDAEISAYLATVPIPAGGMISKEQYLKSGEKVRFSIQYDPDQPLNRAFLSLWRKAGPDFGSWFARLEFSAYQAGPLGLGRIVEGFELAASFLSFEKFLKTAKISRLDVAIDCIGTLPIDLIAHVPKEGKRIVYVGDNGRPETVYIREKKKHPTSPPQKKIQTYGPLRLRVYDRAARQKQLALPALYGPAPVTRVETTIRWKTGRPSLSELLEVSNRLAGVRVAYASAIKSKSAEAWHDFCLKALAQGAANTYLPVGLISFLKLYEKCAGDLVNQTNWSEWDRGLEITGLAAWIATAKKGTAEPSCN